MYLFLRLLLAHFIADFPLQTSKVYTLKCGHGPGKSAHSLIIFIVSIFFVIPYWSYPSMWVYVTVSGLIHHASDTIKLAWNKTGNPRNFLFRYVGDQLVHVATAAGIFLLPLHELRLPMAGGGLVQKIYASDFLMLYGSLLIVATYFGTYFIEAFKKSYLPERYVEILPRSYKFQGIFERMVLFHLAYLGGFGWVIVPLALLPRFLMQRFWKADFINKSRPTSVLDIALTLLLGLIPGLVLSLLQGLI